MCTLIAYLSIRAWKPALTVSNQKTERLISSQKLEQMNNLTFSLQAFRYSCQRGMLYAWSPYSCDPVWIKGAQTKIKLWYFSEQMDKEKKCMQCILYTNIFSSII